MTTETKTQPTLSTLMRCPQCKSADLVHLVSPGGTVNRECVACGSRFMAEPTKTQQWYEDEINRLAEEVRAFRAEQQARINNRVGKEILIALAPEMAELLRQLFTNRLITDGKHFVIPVSDEEAQEAKRILSQIGGQP
jgi:Zn ribbon nucleic-acid-binding protein